MKYCVTLQLRDLHSNSSKFTTLPILHSCYYESDNIRDLNDWIFHHVCNSGDSMEIINLYFECID